MSSPSISDNSPPPSPPPDPGYNPDDPDQPTEDIRDQSTAPITNPRADVDDLSDNDSVLSDVDEAQFEDFDPNQVAIEERPIAVDEDTVKLLGRHKRKRADGEVDGDGGKKKKKEGKREKVKKARKRQDSDDDFSGGQEVEGKRVRKRKAFTEEGGKPRKEKQKPRKPSPENEEELDPEERKSIQERYSLVEHRLK
jgi:transcription factor SPN1